jgi:hypothetical protein
MFDPTLPRILFAAILPSGLVGLIFAKKGRKGCAIACLILMFLLFLGSWITAAKEASDKRQATPAATTQY